MNRTAEFVVIAACLVAACGMTEPQILQIEGIWQFTDNATASDVSFSCSSAGTITITQIDATFFGAINQTSAVCSDQFGNVRDRPAMSLVTGGQINANQVSFETSNCMFNGTISGSPPNRISGSESCGIAWFGTNVTVTGTWQGTR
jgi:hypothetical protein